MYNADCMLALFCIRHFCRHSHFW